jgi:anaerobic ribonucleoside-triphosphate reductase activating protein
MFTPLGETRFAAFERLATSTDRKFDLMIDDSGSVWLAGIPGRDDFNRLSTALATQSHKISTTQDRSVGAPRSQAND